VTPRARRATGLAAAAIALLLLLAARGLRRDDYPGATPAMMTDRVVDLTDRPARDPRRARPDDPIWRYAWVTPDDQPRTVRRQVRQVLDRVAARPGMRIADVGAGGGWFTFYLARVVGPSGVVIATDMDLRMAQLLAFTRRQRGLQNVRVLHVPPDSPGLPPASVDVVLMVNVGLLQDRTNDPAQVRRYVAQVADALRPGGRFVYATEFVVDDRRHRGADESAALASERFTLEHIDTAPVERGPDSDRPMQGYVITLRRR
jgi:SAM-dependent methyltransferase